MGYDYDNGLGILKDWVLSEGYKSVNLSYSGVSYVSWVPKTLNTPAKMEIEGKYCDEIKTYIFLHEIGHHLLRRDWEQFTVEFPILSHAEAVSVKDKVHKYKRRTTYTVCSLKEEYRAWEEGRKLGESLGVVIDIDKWNAIKTKSLMSYIRYYADL